MRVLGEGIGVRYSGRQCIERVAGGGDLEDWGHGDWAAAGSGGERKAEERERGDYG